MAPKKAATLVESVGGSRLLAIVLAGGEGQRLAPLTNDRAKPAVPFGGRYRLIDIVLSNFINSGFYKIIVLTQYKSDSLHRHIRKYWNLSQMIGHYVDTVPAQMRIGRDWYKGSADAVFQNLYLIRNEMPDCVAVFGSDHIYHMDIRQMLDRHLACGAELTVAAIPCPVGDAGRFGVCSVDGDGRMTAFSEKPAEPCPMPDDPARALVSMGNYIFSTAALLSVLPEEADDPASGGDFGRDIVPRMVARGRTFVYDFNTNQIAGNPRHGGENYWRDVGDVDSYYAASIDLVSVDPPFNLYNPSWPVLATSRHLPPAKFVFGDAEHDRVGLAIDSMVAEGCIVSGGRVTNSLLFQNVRVNSWATVDRCVLFEGVGVGRYARLRGCIIDRGVHVPTGTVIGYDPEHDRRRFAVSPGGVVVIPKGAVIPADPDFRLPVPPERRR